MIIGRHVIPEPAPQVFVGDSGRLWKVVKDPSGSFMGNLFRFVDLEAGGFDRGTVFEHIQTGKRRIVCQDGINRKWEHHENSTTLRRSTSTALSRAQDAANRLRSTGNANRRLPA